MSAKPPDEMNEGCWPEEAPTTDGLRSHVRSMFHESEDKPGGVYRQRIRATFVAYAEPVDSWNGLLGQIMINARAENSLDR